MAVVLLQVGVQVILATGFSTCLWWILKRPPLAEHFNWLWLGLAGVGVPAFLLQTLVYAGLPLRLTAWPVFTIALVGTLACLPALWRIFRTSQGLRSDAGLGVVIFLITLSVQTAGLLSLGPSRYHGAGHYDQATYVVTAEFLVSEPFATTRENVGYQPWMLRALEMKPGRITETVALGTVAVLTRTDCQQAYGAVNGFFVALLALAVAGLARTCGLPRWAAGGAALLAGLAPAVTRIHLEGFFSQVTSLFVFPALVGALGHPEVPRRLKIVGAGTMLAFLFGTYTELTPFGIMFVCALQAVARGPWRGRLEDLALVISVSLLANAGYSLRLFDYFSSQILTAQDPMNLAALFPDSGTWAGWGRIFGESDSAPLVGILGVSITVLVLFGCFRLVNQRRLALPATTLLAGLTLVYLRWGDGFHPYVFAKLGIEFIGVWTTGVFAGITLLAGRGFRSEGVKLSIGALVVAVAAIATFRRQVEIMNPSGRLALLTSEQLAEVRQTAALHPERTYLVACNDPLIAEWLAYFGRHSRVVLDRRTFGDRIVTTEDNACRRWRGRPEELWWLDPVQTGPVSGYEPPPALQIEGALATQNGPAGRDYVVGDQVELNLVAGPADRRREVWLDFVVVPRQAGKALQLWMTDRAGQVVARRIDGAGWVRWALPVGAGGNQFKLSVHAEDGSSRPAEGSLLIKFASVEVSAQLPSVDGVPGRFL